MTHKLKSLIFTVTALLLFFSVNVSHAVDIKFSGKIKTVNGLEYEGKVTSVSTSGNNESIRVLYQGNLTFIQVDKIKTIEMLDSAEKKLAFEFKTGEKYVVKGLNDSSAHLTHIYIEQGIGKIVIDIAKIKKITFYKILKTD